MGYRANVVTQSRKYGSQTFCDWDNFTDKFIPAVAELGYDVNSDDNQEFFEIEKVKLQEFVDTLPENDEQSISNEHTNSDLKADLQQAIDEVKEEWISWEWF